MAAKDKRQVTVTINGVQIELNGFVQDLFQEVTVALVRSLGGENPDGSIEVKVAAADE